MGSGSWISVFVYVDDMKRYSNLPFTQIHTIYFADNINMILCAKRNIDFIDVSSCNDSRE